MLKNYVIVVIMGLIIGCATTTKTTNGASNLNGIWIPVKQELGGKPLPKSVFEKEVLIIADSEYTLAAESVDRGGLTYAKGNMDIYGKEGVNAGKHFTAIYAREDNKLTICYNLSGDSYPESFETKSKPSLFISVFMKK